MIRHLAGAAVALLLAAPALAQELPACPDSVTVVDGWQGEVPQGWQQQRRQTEHRLLDIRFHVGNPATGTVIEPIGASSRGSVVSVRYGLPAVEGEIWMSCIYADTAHTLVRALARPFPPHVRVNHDRQDRRTFVTYF